MNAFAKAFADAGYKSPRDQAIQVAVEAWRRWPQADAGGARRDHVAAEFAQQSAWAWVTEFQPSIATQAIGALLNVARDLIRAETASASAKPKPKIAAVKTRGATDAGGNNPAGGGHIVYDTQRPIAPATSPPDRAQPETDASGGDTTTRNATPKAAPSIASNLTALADKHAAATRASSVALVSLSRLDTVKIGAKPIGDCTVGEVRFWAAQRQHDARAAGRDARFALILAANLSSEKIIRQYWQDPAEVDALYAKAEAEHAA